VALLRLPAPGLRGTFAKAYHLLTLLASKIGWDELLKTRSQVFVMEEEYRLHKTHASIDVNGLNDTSSVTGMKSPAPPETEELEVPGSAVSATPSEIPTIRISTESARTPNPVNGDGKFPERVAEVNEDDDAEETLSHTGTEEPDHETEAVLEKPETAHEKEDATGAAGVLSDEGGESVSAFSNKRLCERWLGELIILASWSPDGS
jgi:hypothetical protein